MGVHNELFLRRSFIAFLVMCAIVFVSYQIAPIEMTKLQHACRNEG
jgi:hypothetical protein